MLFKEMCRIKSQFKQKIELYGFRAALLRILKRILSLCIGFKWEKCYLMSRELYGIQAPQERNDIEVRKLKMTDYANSKWKTFLDEEKRMIYESRFQDSTTKAYGAFINGELAYSTWILYGEVVFREKVSLIKSDDCALLLDSYCHPDFRGRGLHNYMNHWCLYEMGNRGIKKGYVIVLSYNRPAIKTQRKCGLQMEKTFYGFKMGSWEYCTMKSYHRKES